MAFKIALLSFEFSKLDDIECDRGLDFDFSVCDLLPGEGLQPLIVEATSRIKRAIAKTISSYFNFNKATLTNLSNLLHVATFSFNTEIQHTDGSYGECCIVNVVKFYRLEPKNVYKVAIDIEELPSTAMTTSSKMAFKTGVTNKQIEKLVTLLDEEFQLNGQIEYIPFIKRGRTDKPHYLISSDDRVMEYDFDKLLFHEKSEFQDVKIVSSPSLGNILLLDNLQNLAEVDLEYTYALMDRGNVSYKSKEILILGGGDGGLLWELLKEEPKFVTMAEIDPVVIEACRQHLQPCGKCLESLEGPNYKIIVDDCLKVLRQSVQSGKKYDVIFNDLTDIPVSKRPESLTAFDSSAKQSNNPWHFIESIFNLSIDCLAPSGLYMNHATGKGNREALQAYEDFLESSTHDVTYKSRCSYVPSFMEIWTFYTVKRKNDN